MRASRSMSLTPAVLREIEGSRIEFFIINSPRAALTLFAATSVVAAVYAQYVALREVLAWMVVVTAVVALRLALCRFVSRKPPLSDDFFKFGRLTGYLTFLLGMQWAIPMMLWFPDVDVRAQSITLLVIMCSVFGSLASTAVYMPAFASYAVSSLGVSFWILLNSSSALFTGLTALSAIATVFAFLSARSFQRVFEDAVLIRSDNVHLLNELKESHIALVRADQARTKFVAAVSHDIRQPLTALELLVHQAANTTDSAEKIDLIRKMESSISGLTRLVHAVLDIAKFDSDAVKVNAESVELRSLFDELKGEFEPLARLRSLELSFDVNDCHLSLDSILFKQAVANLIDNAIKYTKDGGVSVVATLDGISLVVDVIDSGCGVPASMRTDIFNDFFRGANSDRKVVPGWGLGLAISTRAVKKLGGTLELLAQAEQKGTRFQIRIPVQAIAPSRLPSAEQPRVCKSDLNLRVVVLDDDEMIVDALVVTLASLGHDAIGFGSIDAAWEVIFDNRGNIDLIVVDLHLNADVDGFEVLKMIKNVDPTIQGILMTADLSAENRRRAGAFGYGFIQKPFAEQALMSELANLWGWHDEAAACPNGLGTVA